MKQLLDKSHFVLAYCAEWGKEFGKFWGSSLLCWTSALLYAIDKWLKFKCKKLHLTSQVIRGIKMIQTHNLKSWGWNRFCYTMCNKPLLAGLPHFPQWCKHRLEHSTIIQSMHMLVMYHAAMWVFCTVLYCVCSYLVAS